MLYPSVQDLTNKDVNRYMLVIAAAKGARYITYKQNEEDEYGEMHREFDKSYVEDDPNEKAVSLAVNKFQKGDFSVIVE